MPGAVFGQNHRVMMQKRPVLSFSGETCAPPEFFLREVFAPKLIPIWMIFFDFSRLLLFKMCFVIELVGKDIGQPQNKEQIGIKKRSRIKIIWKKSPEA